MRPVGFSTGALCRGRFRDGLRMMEGRPASAVELSALRWAELGPLLGELHSLDLGRYSYISVHAPSRFDAAQERVLAAELGALVPRGWPVVLHPDAVHDFRCWEPLGELLLIENMDRRKPTGRTVAELAEIFERLPRASLCFDIGHAWQVDPSMDEAALILRRFGPRLRQLHVSEVSAGSEHLPLSPAAIAAFRRVAALVPEEVPLILETPVPPSGLDAEIEHARAALQQDPDPA